MKRPEVRHYTEEELLVHSFGEEPPSLAKQIAGHLLECRQCSAICLEFEALRSSVTSWRVPALPEDSWAARKAELMAQFRMEQASLRPQRGVLVGLRRMLSAGWEYALENPLPTIAYIAVALAFASERTITVFRLDRILPASSAVFEILRQIL
jgi:hypothetical protein